MGIYIIDTKQVGDVGEARVIYEFQKHGINVLQPFSDHSPYDLVIDYNGSLKKIQVKTSTCENNGTISFTLKKTRFNRTKAYSKYYDASEVDYYALYSTVRDKVYLVKFDQAPKGHITIRYKDAKCDTSKIIRKEETYLIENVIKQLETSGDVAELV